uniref:Motile sperm domain-containing protein 1 n=1 Tax=Meloidogyne hapla TaxID=6305 RepID=A0A1I8BUL3_MELHA
MDIPNQKAQRLPVFVQPVLCNAPSNYALGLTKGTIRAGCYIDITIRHRNPTVIGSDCLRIEICSLNDSALSGIKSIQLNTLKTSIPPKNISSTSMLEFDENEMATTSTRQSTTNSSRSIHKFSAASRGRRSDGGIGENNTQSFYWLAVISFLFCVSVLLTPRWIDPEQQQQQYTFIPNWLRPSVTGQCVASYVLGILTVYFFLQPIAI